MKTHSYLKPKEVTAWFKKHSSTMIVALEAGTYFGKYEYFSENENVFFSKDGKEKLVCSVSYEEGCPTCGGAYVKEWSLWDLS